MIHDENNVLLDDELVVVRSQLKKPKHACLYVRNDACYMSEMMCVYMSKMNIFVDFVLNKNDRGINNTRKTSWTCRSTS